MEGVRLAIVGWRGMSDQVLFDTTLAHFVNLYGFPQLVISGGATGADTMGEKWAKEHNIPTMIYKPKWYNNGVYDKSAGIKRNTDIVNACTHMVAFPNDEKGKGTQDSIRKAQKAGKVVVEVKVL